MTKLIDVEYEPHTRAHRVERKTGQIYVGVGTRDSDGFTVLKIRAPGATRNHNIEVGQLYAITVDGQRHVLKTPWDRWRIRAQEVTRLLDGKFSESWAAAYFDPNDSKYYGHCPVLAAEPPADDEFAMTPEELERARRQGKFIITGALVIITFALIIVASI